MFTFASLAKPLYRKLFCFLVIGIAQSCATYYQSTYDFNQAFEKGELENALAQLRTSPSRDYRKKEFLYQVNSGLLLSILGRYEESNVHLESAFLLGEDYHKNYINEAASFLTNPQFISYRGEDHEHLLLLYYKAINFLKMKKTDEALVECRRLNIRLQQLSDRYSDDKKYKRDAFIHLLMGIIYETDKDYNNAFIAYRNAYEIYQSDYTELFGLSAPPQLKIDLVKTAMLAGMSNEFLYYKEEFGMQDYIYQEPEGGELVFFWHNGLVPVKSEWSVNFAITRNDNWVTFHNAELGLSFPFPIGDYDEKEKRGLADLEFFRVAFPKYIERPTYFRGAVLAIDSLQVPLEPIEDINRIAFKVLQQRMTLEFSKALLRAAVKKVTEYQFRKENKALGSLFGLFGAITEKADTRNWQTLPYAIYYSRVPLKLGTNKVELSLEVAGGKPSVRYEFTYIMEKKGTQFHTFTSLETNYHGTGFY